MRGLSGTGLFVRRAGPATRKRAAVYAVAIVALLIIVYGGMQYVVQLHKETDGEGEVPRLDATRISSSFDRRDAGTRQDTASQPARLSADLEAAGFVHPSVAAVPEDRHLPQEEDKGYALLNLQYHGKRARLRQFQSDNHAGPLRIHTFYTVDCTLHSLWQVLALEQSWDDVQQGGFITRIIAGCKAGSDKAALWQQSVLPPQVAATRFGSYYAPESSVLPNGKYYAPYNRPNAIWYWLNHTDLTEQIFVLTDPDMFYMHRLNVASVERGRPAAQYYGYMEGTAFERYRCPLCPDAGRAYGRGGIHTKKSYSVGPPWMLHVDDFRTMMPTWVQLVPMLRDIDDIWIIEMVAYAVAAAFHDLPHGLVYHGMIDNVRQEPLWDAHTHTIVRPNRQTDGQEVALLHYCYTWEVGEAPPRTAEDGGRQHDRMVRREKLEKKPILDYYHWSKYRTPSDWPGGKGSYPHNVLDCNCPLLQEIHTTNAMPLTTDKTMGENWRRTMVFLRTYLPGLNRALTAWKQTVLNCTVPTLEEEAEFEAAVEQFQTGVSGAVDPTSVRAPSKFKRIINLAQQLRTSHPTYWVSNYVIRSTSDDLRTVVYVEAKDARASIYRTLRLAAASHDRSSSNQSASS